MVVGTPFGPELFVEAASDWIGFTFSCWKAATLFVISETLTNMVVEHDKTFGATMVRTPYENADERIFNFEPLFVCFLFDPCTSELTNET